MSDEEAVAVPVYQEYMNAILDVLRVERAGLPIEALDKRVFERMDVSQPVLALPHDPAKPDRSEAAYRCAWARTYLKQAGYLTNPKRGVWAVTDAGRAAGQIDPYAVASGVAAKYKHATAGEGHDEPQESADQVDAETSQALDEELTAARVGNQLAEEIRALHGELLASGELLSPEQIERCLGAFRARFGPDVLSSLDGEALLTRMHGRGARDSLVHWLEFKDDEEFAAQFGGIGGGSALKFGLYQAAESAKWMSGTGKQQRVLSVDEAIGMARTQRNQLLAGVRVLERFPKTPLGGDYAELQADLTSAAPDLAETSWGHKYFALLFPDLLEPIHGEGTQRHHLFKLLKLPGEGRYVNARIFIGVAQQLGMSVLDLARTLHKRNGPAHEYWRVGTTTDDKSEWPRMLAGGFASVGWDTLGDLTNVDASPAGREDIRARMEANFPGAPQAVSKAANQLFNFTKTAQERDIVVAMEGKRVRGVGRIAGPYFYRAADGPFPHRRPVEWLLESDWQFPETEGLQTTFVKLGKFPRNLVELETRLLGRKSAPKPVVTADVPAEHAAPPPPLPPAALTGVPARVEAVLKRKLQVILHGPPGTGKTYWAERSAQELAARSWFGVEWKAVTEQQHRTLQDEGAIEVCAFHPAYGYEDFLEGYRPGSRDGALAFELRDGVFKRMCARARENRERGYFLVIDEINRGDIPRIFGELLLVVEKDKRDKEVALPLSGTRFAVPPNVFIIGTMNTADRSIALLDAALRRRFGFVELLPDSAALAGAVIHDLPIGRWLEELNRRVVKNAGRDARSLQIGHSYLMPRGAPVRELAVFAEILRDDIIPLLAEYCYDDFDALARILGDKIILKADRRVNEKLLEPEGHPELLDALRAAFETLLVTKEAVAAEGETSAPVDDDATSA